jgi:transposase
MQNQDVARELRLDVHTVGKWRERFRISRLEGLADDPRPGAPRQISGRQVEEVITRTLEKAPAQGTHWSTRTMAKQSGLSQTAVSRIWRAFALQPHRTESFQLSADPFFVGKVRDIVGLYLNPPDRAIVLCIDEKSQAQALDRTQPVLPLRLEFPNARLTITSATGPHRCLRLWTLPLVRSLAPAIVVIGTRSSCASSKRSHRKFPPVSRSMS